MDSKGAVKCFVVGLSRAELDPVLEAQGVASGIMMFSIPQLGILFRCRASGEPVDLEFGALFALLKFIESKLSEQNISNLHIFSSNPEFVFAFTGNSRHLKPNSQRMKLLTEYNRQIKMAVSFVDAVKNQALVLASEYPSMPKSREVKMPSDDERSQPRFQPVQKGIKF